MTELHEDLRLMLDEMYERRHGWTVEAAATLGVRRETISRAYNKGKVSNDLFAKLSAEYRHFCECGIRPLIDGDVEEWSIGVVEKRSRDPNVIDEIIVMRLVRPMMIMRAVVLEEAGEVRAELFSRWIEKCSSEDQRKSIEAQAVDRAMHAARFRRMEEQERQIRLERNSTARKRNTLEAHELAQLMGVELRTHAEQTATLYQIEDALNKDLSHLTSEKKKMVTELETGLEKGGLSTSARKGALVMGADLAVVSAQIGELRMLARFVEKCLQDEHVSPQAEFFSTRAYALAPYATNLNELRRASIADGEVDPDEPHHATAVTTRKALQLEVSARERQADQETNYISYSMADFTDLPDVSEEQIRKRKQPSAVEMDGGIAARDPRQAAYWDTIKGRE